MSSRLCIRWSNWPTVQAAEYRNRRSSKPCRRAGSRSTIPSESCSTGTATTSWPTDATSDPKEDMRICEVERPGYSRAGKLPRAADVIVLRFQPQPPEGGD